MLLTKKVINIFLLLFIIGFYYRKYVNLYVLLLYQECQA